MKILAVNNTVMYEKEDEIFVFKETGRFFLELQNQGNNVSVFQISMPKKSGDSFANFNLRGKGLEIINVKRRRSRIFAYVKAFFVGLKAVSRTDFVYIFYPGPICVFLALASIALRKNFGIYVRGQQGLNSKVAQYLYKRANVIFTVSPKFTELISLNSSNVFTIRPMLDVGEEHIARNRLYQSKKKYKFLYVGRIVKDKGVYELISAGRNLLEAGYHNFTIFLIGDGPEVAALQRIIKEHNLSDNIVLTGIVSERERLSSYYSEADVFVLPSYHEGFPRVLYEAMIFGVPIVTTFVGSIPYLMKDKLNCYRIQVRDDKQLYQILKRFVLDYPEMAKVGYQGTSTIIDYLSDKKERHATQLHNFINSK